MKQSILGAILIAGAALAVMPTQAYAAACSTNDVTLIIGATHYTAAKCADGVAQGGGGITETGSLNTQLATSGFVYLDSSGDSSTPTGLGGISFIVSVTSNSNAGDQGTWTIAWTEQAGLPNLPLKMDLDVGLFGGNNGSGYLFSQVLLTSANSPGTGSFDINFTNNGGHQPNLSHLLVAGGNTNPYVQSVPEPMSLAVIGFGIASLGMARRRKAA